MVVAREYIYIMGHDIIDWDRIKRLVVEIAELDGCVITFDGDKAVSLGYTKLEQVIAEQVLQCVEPIPFTTAEKLKCLFVVGGTIIRVVYISEVRLVFVTFVEKGCFIVVDEAALF